MYGMTKKQYIYAMKPFLGQLKYGGDLDTECH